MHSAILLVNNYNKSLPCQVSVVKYNIIVNKLTVIKNINTFTFYNKWP